MFARPGFASRLIKGDARLLPLAGLPVIHELPSQNIQGGLPNEHYHLTLAELGGLQEFLASGLEKPIYEPVYANHEGVTSGDGDILMAPGGSYA